MEFRSRLVTAQVQAACRPFFCKNKIGNSWLTNAAFHGILIDVNGALAQLVAHNTGSVGVSGSNPLCSTSRNPWRCKGFGFLFAHKYHQTYHCCVSDSWQEGRAALPLDSCFLILADELFQLLCGLLTHVGIAMTVHV